MNVWHINISATKTAKYLDTGNKSNNPDIIAALCGYDLNNHHAPADAEACAAIALKILYS